MRLLLGIDPLSDCATILLAMDRPEMTIGEGGQLLELSHVVHVDQVPDPPIGEVRLEVGPGQVLAIGWFSVGRTRLRGEDGFIVLVPEGCTPSVAVAIVSENSETGESVPLPRGARSSLAVILRAVLEASVLRKEDIFRAAHKRIADRGDILRGGAGEADEREIVVANMTSLVRACAWLSMQHIFEHRPSGAPPTRRVG